MTKTIDALVEALDSLLGQVNLFCEQHGEADFETAQAVAALAQARAEQAEPVAWRWIDIQEQVPERGTNCLILSQEPWEKCPSVKLDTWDEQHEAPLPFSSATVPVGEGWDNDSACVTHWMQCPPADAATTPPAAPVAKLEPVAWMTLDDEGSPAMLFFDRQEAENYCGEGEEPTPLVAAHNAKLGGT